MAGVVTFEYSAERVFVYFDYEARLTSSGFAKCRLLSSFLTTTFSPASLSLMSFSLIVSSAPHQKQWALLYINTIGEDYP